MASEITRKLEMMDQRLTQTRLENEERLRKLNTASDSIRVFRFRSEKNRAELAELALQQSPLDEQLAELKRLHMVCSVACLIGARSCCLCFVAVVVPEEGRAGDGGEGEAHGDRETAEDRIGEGGADENEGGDGGGVHQPSQGGLEDGDRGAGRPSQGAETEEIRKGKGNAGSQEKRGNAPEKAKRRGFEERHRSETDRDRPAQGRRVPSRVAPQ